jgi:iron complex outermembrane receptor protein
VNGIINVISRNATQTKGPLVAGGYGTELGTAEARYGWGTAPWSFRAYGKYAAQANSELENDTPVRDASHRWLAGARGRWDDAVNAFTFESAGYRNLIDQVPGPARRVRAVRARPLDSPARAGAPFWLAVYYERTRREQPGAIVDQLDTYDIQFQNEFRAARHTLVWGAGYRYQNDQVDLLSPGFALIPDDKKLTYGQLFAEDALHFAERIDLTLGLRVEHNVYTDFEWMPTARLAWRPAPDHMLWTAYSRAVRSPSRVDREFYSPAAPPHFCSTAAPPSSRSTSTCTSWAIAASRLPHCPTR